MLCKFSLENNNLYTFSSCSSPFSIFKLETLFLKEYCQCYTVNFRLCAIEMEKDDNSSVGDSCMIYIFLIYKKQFQFLSDVFVSHKIFSLIIQFSNVGFLQTLFIFLQKKIFPTAKINCSIDFEFQSLFVCLMKMPHSQITEISIICQWF